MANRRNVISNRVCQFWHWMQRAILSAFLIGVAMAGSGCTVAGTFAMKDAFPISGAMPSGPPIIVLPIQESQEEGPYKADQAYVGEGFEYGALGPILFPPIVILSYKFKSDTPRTDIVRMAVLSRLKYHGIPATYQATGGLEQLRVLSEDRLALSMSIRTFNVKPNSSFIDWLVLSGWASQGVVIAHTVLDCQLWQLNNSAPLWQGTGEGRYVGNGLVGTSYVDGTVLSKAVAAAVDQCVTKSGLLETRSRLSSQRYAKLTASGHKQEAAGNTTKALDMYSQAYVTAVNPEQNGEALQAIAQLIRTMPAKPVLPEEARKFKVQAEFAVRDKQFSDAADLYGQALTIAPWWPQGHYNRALVSAEAGDLPSAMQEMKHYLALLPDAPDARTAQDRIYGWEQGIKNPEAAQKNLKTAKVERDADSASNPAEAIAYQEAKSLNTLTAYGEFLHAYPSSPNKREALTTMSLLIKKQEDPYQGYKKFIVEYEEGVEFVPSPYRVSLIGPEGMRVHDILNLRKHGVEEKVIAAKIRVQNAVYKDFNLEEIGALKSMGMTGGLIEAMLDSTTRAKRDQEELQKKKEMENLLAEIQRTQKKLDEAKAAQERQQSQGVTEQQGSGPSLGDTVKNCAAQIAALEACKHLPWPANSVCAATAKSQFPCQ